MHRYPFMNNNACQIYFYLTPNLLVWIEIINIHKQVTHIMHCLSGVQYLYVCHTAAPGSFKVPSQPGVRPVRPSTGIWQRALREVEKPFSSRNFIIALGILIFLQHRLDLNKSIKFNRGGGWLSKLYMPNWQFKVSDQYQGIPKCQTIIFHLSSLTEVKSAWNLQHQLKKLCL